MGSRIDGQPARGRLRPLDGVRGLAIIVLMLYHFGAGFLPGAWVGINLFFVFSGFLIVRLLLAEYDRYGRIDPWAFYRRRALRLLPALIVLLATLAVWGMTMAQTAVRRPLKWDLLATLGYFMNWRLVSTSDSYFTDFGTPSPLRHAWTLSVEEQFYLIVPMVVFLLVRHVRRRWPIVLVVGGCAAVSAVWTAHVGVLGAAAQAHAYYGTDTRSQALLVGVALAFVLGRWPGAPTVALPPRGLVVAFGWAAVVVSFVGFATIGPMQPWMFTRGGLLLYSLVAAAVIVACVETRANSLSRVFSIRPLVYLGERTYGLYLWHWPIAIWLGLYLPSLSGPALMATGVVVTVAVAALSYRFVERPVMSGALGPRQLRAALAVSVATVVIAAVGVGRVPTVEQEIAAGHVPSLVDGQPRYRPGTTTLRAAIFGDSVPYYLAQQFPRRTYRDLRLTNLAVPGCDLLGLTVMWSDQVRRAPDAECVTMRRKLVSRLRAARAQVLVLMVGSTLALPHLTSDGRRMDPGSARFDALIDAALDRLAAQARAAGVRQVQLATLPCRDGDVNRITGFETDVRPWLRAHPQYVQRLADPVAINAQLSTWAKRHGAGVLDLYSALGCQHGYTRQLHGITLFADELHFSDEAAPMVWTWLAPRIRTTWQDRVTYGGAS